MGKKEMENMCSSTSKHFKMRQKQKSEKQYVELSAQLAHCTYTPTVCACSTRQLSLGADIIC